MTWLSGRAAQAGVNLPAHLQAANSSEQRFVFGFPVVRWRRAYVNDAKREAVDRCLLSQNHSVQAVLFDRDGVLTYFDVESATAFFRPLIPITVYELGARWHAMGTAHGFPRNLAEEQAFFARFWQQIGSEFALTPQQFANLETLDYTRFIVPYPEVRMVLEQLRSANIQMGVLSNFSMASLEQSLVTAGLAEFFAVVCAASVVGITKPSPEAYDIALAAMQVRPESCLFFDDEVSCVEGARDLGLRAYLVDRQAIVHDLRHAVVTNLEPVLPLALQQL
jgi:putative hydrolase of the HAD superfamily